MHAELFSRTVGIWHGSTDGRGHLGPTGARAGFEEMNNRNWAEGEEALKGAKGRAKLLLLATTDKERWWRKAKRKSM